MRGEDLRGRRAGGPLLAGEHLPAHAGGRDADRADAVDGDPVGGQLPGQRLYAGQRRRQGDRL